MAILEKFSLVILVFNFYQCIIYSADIVCRSNSVLNSNIHSGDILYVSSPQHPNPYTFYSKQKCQVNILPDDGYGVLMMLHQFFFDENDYLTVQTTDNTITRWGTTEDLIRSDKPFFRSKGQITILAGRKEGTGSSRNHSGFRAVLKTYNISEGDECGGEYTINDTYFITSSNYNSNYDNDMECQWKLSAGQKLRVVVTDFSTDEEVDRFEIGPEDGSSVSISGDKSFETPLVYYFNKQIMVRFRSGNSNITELKRRFSLIIDPLIPDESAAVCKGAGQYDMSINNSVTIGTPNYGSYAYDNNLNCNFSFFNPPRNSFIYAELTTEIETCCDGVQLNGIGTDWELLGERSPGIYIANVGIPVIMFFHTDGVRTAAGFTGVVRTQDCNCNDSSAIDVIDNTTIVLTSPGYSTTLNSAYCSNLNCNWKFNFFLNYTLEIQINYMKLRTRPADKIIFTNFKDDILQTLTFDSNTDTKTKLLTVSGGFLSVNFITGNNSVFYYKTAEIPKGFDITITPRSIAYKLDDYHELSDGNPMQPFSIETESGDTVLYTVKSLRNRRITLYVYTLPEYSEVVLDIFDGADIRAPLLSLDDFTTDNSSDYSVSKISSSGDSLTFRFLNPSSGGRRTFAGLFTDLVDNEYNTYCTHPFIIRFDKFVKYEFDTVENDFNKTSKIPTNFTCYMVLHHNGPKTAENEHDLSIRNGMLLDSDQNDTDIGLELYQGATTAQKYFVTSKLPLPSFVFGNYVSLGYKAISPPFYVYAENHKLLDNEILLVVENNSSGFLFSPDFLSPTNLGQLHQRYLLQVYNEPLHKMVFQIHKLLSGCQIVLQSVIGDREGQTLLIQNDMKSYEICGTEITVTYRTNGGINKGMFLEYSLSDKLCENVPVESGSSILQLTYSSLFYYTLIATFLTLKN